jgi:hypothetical protein
MDGNISPHGPAPPQRLTEPAADACDEHLGAGRPFLVNNAMKNWPALTRWDSEYLAAAPTRDRQALPVFYSPAPSQPLHPLGRPMSLAELVERVSGLHAAAPYPDSALFYLKQQPLQHFPTLLKDVRKPAFASADLQEVRLWIGMAGCWSPPHFDHVDNLLCQVRGRKLVRLHSPESSACLYPAFLWPGAAGSPERPPHFSRIEDLRTVDLKRFPRFADAPAAIDLTLEPGEMLYIPPYWWHQVETLEGPAVSVNFWYRSQFGAPYGPESHRIEGEVMTRLQRLYDSAAPPRQAALRAFLRAFCDLAEERAAGPRHDP